MFKINFIKMPELTLISIYDMDEGLPYLSSDKNYIVIKSGYDNFIVFDLEHKHDITSYNEADFKDFGFDNNGALMLFPVGTVKIDIDISIS